jgi:hypothetical protein
MSRYSRIWMRNIGPSLSRVVVVVLVSGVLATRFSVVTSRGFGFDTSWDRERETVVTGHPPTIPKLTQSLESLRLEGLEYTSEVLS